MATIYRGYEIRKSEDGLFAVYKNDSHIYTLPTTSKEEAAMDWIDAEKRRQAKSA